MTQASKADLRAVLAGDQVSSNLVEVVESECADLVSKELMH